MLFTTSMLLASFTLDLSFTPYVITPHTAFPSISPGNKLCTISCMSILAGKYSENASAFLLFHWLWMPRQWVHRDLPYSSVRYELFISLGREKSMTILLCSMKVRHCPWYISRTSDYVCFVLDFGFMKSLCKSHSGKQLVYFHMHIFFILQYTFTFYIIYTIQIMYKRMLDAASIICHGNDSTIICHLQNTKWWQQGFFFQIKVVCKISLWCIITTKKIQSNLCRCLAVRPTTNHSHAKDHPLNKEHSTTLPYFT